jgi:hypothetical protein
MRWVIYAVLAMLKPHWRLVAEILCLRQQLIGKRSINPTLPRGE